MRRPDVSREAFPSDPSLPQLTIASDPGLMREIFRRHLRPLTAKGYDIQECVLSRVRYRRPARCVLQYTLRLVEPGTGRERSQWVSGLLYAEDRAAPISQRLRAADPGQEIPKAFLTFEPVSFIPDLEMLVQKVNAGVDFLITQLFFDDADYFDFVARARAAGIRVPIVPGVMPVVSVASIRRMTTLCGARIPDELSRELDSAGTDDERTLAVGVEWATAQCRELLGRGAPGLHFYTLNRSPATRRVFERLF